MIPFKLKNNRERAEAAEWLEQDANYLRKCAAKYREKGDARLAEIVGNNAAHSEGMAKEIREAIK